MKSISLLMFANMLIILSVFVACSDITEPTDSVMPLNQSTGQIYLYGEEHCVEKILEKELELWNKYYHENKMRHLFIEYPYYSAEFLNLWMQSDGDDILEELFNEWEGTASYNSYTKEFYKKVKSECPETIFHGTDVGHQYHSTGQRFLNYLKDNNMKDTEKYLLAQEAIKQGNYF